MGLPQPPNLPPSQRVAGWSTTPGQDSFYQSWWDVHSLVFNVRPQQVYALTTFAYVAGGIW